MGTKFVGFTVDDRSDRAIKEWLRDTVGWREGNNLVICDMDPGVRYSVLLEPIKKVRKKCSRKRRK
jgi:hypothetical protein